MKEIANTGSKKNDVKTDNSVVRVNKVESFQSRHSPADHVLHLQRTIGNQAVGRLIESGALQAKIKIGQSGDKYEQEADRVAEAVMRIPDLGVQRQPIEEEDEEQIKTKPVIEQITPLVQKQIEDEEEEELLQTKGLDSQSHEVEPGLTNRIQSIKGGGHPLPESTRSFFEPRFGRDLSQVRVHSDSHAAETAQAVNARAFTVGNNIAFGGGQYAPESHEGRNLLGHELTHTIQQGVSDISPSNSSVVQTKEEPAKQNIDIYLPGYSPIAPKRAKAAIPSFAALAADNPGIFAAISFEQQRIWHDMISAYMHNKKISEALARHYKRYRSTSLYPNSTDIIHSSDYLEKRKRIISRLKFVDEVKSRVPLAPAAILSSDIDASQDWNVDAEQRYRTWAIEYFSSKPLEVELTSKRELVGTLEGQQHPELVSCIPHVNLLWDGRRIKHTKGIVTWNDLMDINDFKKEYIARVSNSPEIQALHKGIDEIGWHIIQMKSAHQERSDANAADWWTGAVRHTSEFLGGPDTFELLALRERVKKNPSDLDLKVALANMEAEAGSYPKLKDNEKGEGIWHDSDQTLEAARQYLWDDQFELAVAALRLCEESTAVAAAKFAGYERRVTSGAGTALKYLQYAKTAGKIASTFTGTGGVVRASLGAAGYSFAVEGTEDVVANLIDPTNKIDLEGLAKQAAIEGLVSMFGGVTQGAFVKALSARFGARLATKYALSEKTVEVILNVAGATTSSFYNVPAEIVLKKIISGEAVPSSLADVARMVTEEAITSSLMEFAGAFVQARWGMSGSDIAAPHAVVEALAGPEGSSLPSLPKVSSEITPQQAQKVVAYVNKHPEAIKDRNKPGKRHAPVGEGHEIVEVTSMDRDAPLGIGCLLRSPGGLSVPCPRGMGGSGRLVEQGEINRLLERDLPPDVKNDLFKTLDQALSSRDYDPEHLARMITALRSMNQSNLSRFMSARVQINRNTETMVYHTKESIWWDRMDKSHTEEITMLEAQLRGYGKSEGPRRRRTRTSIRAEGATLAETTTLGGEHSISSLIGDTMPREGLEAVLPSRGEVRNTALRQSFNIMVAERLHMVGAGFGAETATGVAHGSSFVNQYLQNRGVEDLIRTLHKNRPEGIRYIVHIDGRTRVAGDGETQILERITYRVSAVEELPNGELKKLRDIFEGTISHPQEIRAATRSRGRGDIQGIGLEVESGYGALMEHFGL